MDPLREMFQHHSWATLSLIDHCASLPDQRLREAIPGTYGPILPTLIHLVGADQRYLMRLMGEMPDLTAGEAREPSLQELRDRFAAQSEKWQKVLDHVDALNVTILAHDDWPETPHSENLLLVQAIHHGNDHRTQICSTLGAFGLSVPELDVWNYWLMTKAG